MISPPPSLRLPVVEVAFGAGAAVGRSPAGAGLRAGTKARAEATAGKFVGVLATALGPGLAAALAGPVAL